MKGARSYVSGMSLVLLLASALLGGLFYLQWHNDVELAYRQTSVDKAAEESGQKREVEDVPPFQPVPLRSLSEITERPLFTEGRTPPEKPAEAVQAAPASQPLRLKLEGVAITPESKVAVITDLQTNELLRLSQGMSHRDWKVTEVTEGAVTIEQGGREISLTLEIDEATGASGGRPRVPFKLPVRPPPRR